MESCVTPKGWEPFEDGWFVKGASLGGVPAIAVWDGVRGQAGKRAIFKGTVPLVTHARKWAKSWKSVAPLSGVVFQLSEEFIPPSLRISKVA